LRILSKKVNAKKVCLGLIALMGAILIIVSTRAGKFLVREQLPSQPVSAIILMGSLPNRALAAISLFNRGFIKKFYIVEENMLGLSPLHERGYDLITNSEQMKSILMQAGIDDSIITIIPGMARSTIMEAKAFTNWMALHPEAKPDTLLIISSATHTRRAFMIFNHILNHKSSNHIFICTYPSPYSGYDAQGWFKTKEDIQTTLSEYLKLLSFLFVEQWK